MATRKLLFVNTASGRPFLDSALSGSDSISFGGAKLTSIANGVDSTDAVAKGQLLPTSALVTNFTSPAVTGEGELALRQYLYPGGFVGLVGKIESSSGTIALGTTLCTLGEGYRPGFTRHLPIISSNGSACFITIDSDGTVDNSRAITAGAEYIVIDLIFKKTNS